MKDKEIKELQRFRSREELKIKLLSVIQNYKSQEEPHIILSNDDIINVLSSMIVRRTQIGMTRKT
jgi:hypothetical protein